MSWRRDRRGVTTVEFAVVALLLFIWIFGMMEVARAYWTYEIMEDVAIEGARCMGVLATGCSASGAYSATNATNYIINKASARGLTLTSGNIALARPTACAGTSGFSSATITYTFTTSLPAVIPALNAVALSSTACHYNLR